MEIFIRSTSWPMELISAYGFFHLAFFLGGLLIIFLITKRLRTISSQSSDWFIFALGLFLLITEIYKQLFYYYVMDPYQYTWWIFPFQMCSIPMYTALMIPFIKNERFKICLLDYMASFGLFGGFISFLEPSGLIHEYWSLTLHAFIWHLVLILLAVHIFTNRSQDFISFKDPMRLFIVLLAIALIINFIVKGVLNQKINMFFAGPEITQIIVFRDISTNFGWFINDLLFFPLLIGAVSLIRKMMMRGFGKGVKVQRSRKYI